jgi:hypothetical protein
VHDKPRDDERGCYHVVEMLFVERQLGADLVNPYHVRNDDSHVERQPDVVYPRPNRPEITRDKERNHIDDTHERVDVVEVIHTWQVQRLVVHFCVCVYDFNVTCL